jgi:hypothetical protein
MSEKKIFAAAGISTSLDTVLATTLGTNYHSRLKKSNPNLLSEKSLSNNSSKSSSGSSLTLTNNANNNNTNCANNNANQYPHHQFYCSQISQISTSANWNSPTGRNSICSQKVSLSTVFLHAMINYPPRRVAIDSNYLNKRLSEKRSLSQHLIT